MLVASDERSGDCLDCIRSWDSSATCPWLVPGRRDEVRRPEKESAASRGRREGMVRAELLGCERECVGDGRRFVVEL